MSVQAAEQVLRTLRGVVIGDKCAKTRKVLVHWAVRHPRYGKVVRKSTVYHVHDESNASHLGDQVDIRSCRPLSKTKRWELLNIVEVSPEV